MLQRFYPLGLWLAATQLKMGTCLLLDICALSSRLRALLSCARSRVQKSWRSSGGHRQG